MFDHALNYLYRISKFCLASRYWKIIPANLKLGCWIYKGVSFNICMAHSGMPLNSNLGPMCLLMTYADDLMAVDYFTLTILRILLLSMPWRIVKFCSMTWIYWLTGVSYSILKNSVLTYTRKSNVLAYQNNIHGISIKKIFSLKDLDEDFGEQLVYDHKLLGFIIHFCKDF